MKCLSLWQPWATLIAIGAKRFETRSWSTTYRGPIAIHANKKWNKDLEDCCFDEPYASALCAARPNRGGAFYLADILDELLPRGVIVAVADLTACRKMICQSDDYATLENGDRVYEPEKSFGDYYPGRFAWELTHVRRLKTPLPLIGHQGLFNLPDDLITPAMFESVESVQSVEKFP